MFEFRKLFKVCLCDDKIVCIVDDPSLVDISGAMAIGYHDEHAIPRHKGLPLIRVLIQRRQMRRVWRMSKNGRFANVKPR